MISAACRVVEDRTGNRIILDIHVVLANLVQLGPSLTKRHQLSANAALQAQSLLLPTARSAQAVLCHRIQSMASPAFIPWCQQVHRHVDTQQGLLLRLQYLAFRDPSIMELVACYVVVELTRWRDHVYNAIVAPTA